MVIFIRMEQEKLRPGNFLKFCEFLILKTCHHQGNICESVMRGMALKHSSSVLLYPGECRPPTETVENWR